MPQFDVKPEGEGAVRLTWGGASSILLTLAEAEALREKLRTAIVAAPTEAHLAKAALTGPAGSSESLT